MKRSITSAFAFMLSVGVSSLAMGQSADPQALITPPPATAPKVRYVPSVPALNADAASTGTPSAAIQNVPKQHYIPSVPARVTEESAVPPLAAPTPAPVAAPVPAPAAAAPMADPEAMSAPAAETAPVVNEPARAATEEPSTPPAPLAIPSAPTPAAEPVVPPVATPTAKVEETKSGQQYIPSTPVRPIQQAEPDAPVATIGNGPADSGLSTALAKAYNFNPELQSFRSRLKAVDEQIPQAYSGWLPTARADYSYGYEREKLNNKNLNGTHPEQKSVTVVQPIFSGGETLARTDRAYNAVNVGRAQLKDAEQRVLGDSVKAYMDVVRTDEILKLSVNNEQVLKEQLQATKDRFKLGETTHTDVAQSESRLARATSDRVKAEGDLDVAKAAYLRLIGEPAPARSSLKMPTKLPPIPKSLENALDIGLQRNPNLVIADMNRNIAENDTDIAIAAVLPDVSLHGTRSEGDKLNSARGFSSTDTSYTLNATIPIFQGGAEYSRVRQNKRTRQQRKEEYDATRNETVQNITSRWRDIITSRASIVSNKAAVDSATVALNGVRQEADVGTRTTLDVLDAEQELFIAKVNLVTAQSQEVLAVHNLLATVGILTAQDLALNVEPYNPKIHEQNVKYRVVGF